MRYYDRKFALMQTIATMIVLILMAGIYIIQFKPTLGDPIQEIKNNYITALFVTMLISTCFMGISKFKLKDRNKLMKYP